MKQSQDWKTPQETDFSEYHQKIAFAYEEVFNSDAGKAVLEDLFRTLRVEHGQEQEPIDPIGFAMRAGERRVYWEIIRRTKLAAAIRKRVVSEIEREQSPLGTPGSIGRF